MDANEQKARELLLASQRELGVTFFSPVSAQEQAAIRAIMAALAQQVPQPVVDVPDVLRAFERKFWQAVSMTDSRDFDHDVCKEVRDFRDAIAALAAHGKPNRELSRAGTASA